MISLPHLFGGIITGLLIVCVFDPPKRQVPAVPTPNDTDLYHTKAGCVTIKTEAIPCSSKAVSLNVLIGK
jgi:hypothetical protein